MERQNREVQVVTTKEAELPDQQIKAVIYGQCVGDAIGLLTEFLTKKDATKVGFLCVCVCACMLICFCTVLCLIIFSALCPSTPRAFNTMTVFLMLKKALLSTKALLLYKQPK